jgi:hypothetical protein
MGYPPRLTGGRIAEVSAAARAAHRVILRAFAATGDAPDPAVFADTTPTGDGVGELLRELHEHDVIRLDEHGHIRAAYPFSGVPAAHTVAIDAGATVTRCVRSTPSVSPTCSAATPPSPPPTRSPAKRSG